MTETDKNKSLYESDNRGGFNLTVEVSINSSDRDR